MAYLLDTDVFIQAKNLHYGIDFCPAFWSWLDVGNRSGRVFSIARVKEELTAGTGELADWAAERGTSFFLGPNEDTLMALARVTRCVMSGEFDASAPTYSSRALTHGSPRMRSLEGGRS